MQFMWGDFQFRGLQAYLLEKGELTSLYSDFRFPIMSATMRQICTDSKFYPDTSVSANPQTPSFETCVQL